MPSRDTAPTEPLEKRKHVPALDGLRGLAIIMVFCDHWSTSYSHGNVARMGVLQRAILATAVGGCSGVDLFFALSGFLITGILLETRGRPKFFSNFYARRTLRIFPPYYLTLALYYFALRPVLSHVWHYNELWSKQLWYWSYLANWLCALQGWQRQMIDHFWTLAVEEQFYLVWPLLVFAAGARRTIWICAGILLASPFLRAAIYFLPLVHYPAPFIYTSTLTRLDPLAAGALLAAAMRIPELRRKVSTHAAAITWSGAAAFAVLIAYNRCYDTDLPSIAILAYSFLAILFTGVLALLVTQGPDHRLNRVFSTRWLRQIGKVSYVAYIVHAPVLALAERLVPGRPALLWLLSAALTLAVSFASWRFFERPLLKLKDRLAPPLSA